MTTTIATDEDRLHGLFQDVIASARVFQGGGSEITTSSLRNAVETAAGRSLIRLFPKFAAGDNANWGKVVTKARDGAPDALVAVGHQGEPTANVVCKEVLAATSAGGSKGAELQKRFGGPPFGWPKDAVNGAILTLLASGNIRAAQDGTPLRGPKELPPTQIGKVTLYKEDEPPTMAQRLAVRGLLTAAEIAYADGQEAPQIPALLQRLKDLAARSGGAPPLPEPPVTAHVEALLGLAGNQLFRAVADDRDRLSEDLERWRVANQERERREAEWQELQRLLRHAEGLPIAATTESAVLAVRDGRQLLDDPNPIAPLLDALADALRNEVKERAKLLASAQYGAIEELQAWEGWAGLEPDTRQSLIKDAQLVSAGSPDLSTDSKLLEVLDATPLAAWLDRISLVPSRRDQARQRAAKQLEPESVSVTPPPATLKTADDLDAYLDDLRKQVEPHLEAKKTVII
jgi:hypothetical protein